MVGPASLRPVRTPGEKRHGRFPIPRCGCKPLDLSTAKVFDRPVRGKQASPQKEKKRRSSVTFVPTVVIRRLSLSSRLTSIKKHHWRKLAWSTHIRVKDTLAAHRSHKDVAVRGVTRRVSPGQLGRCPRE